MNQASNEDMEAKPFQIRTKINFINFAEQAKKAIKDRKMTALRDSMESVAKKSIYMKLHQPKQNKISSLQILLNRSPAKK